MRCLTLADALASQSQSIEVIFICRFLPDQLNEYIVSRGYQRYFLVEHEASHGYDEDALPLEHADWLGISQTRDADECITAIEGLNIDWLVVDHYALDFRWESRLQLQVGKILVIDDLADRRHDCDVLLDQNYYVGMEKRYETLVPDYCISLLGPDIALLREEFLESRKKAKLRDHGVNSILVLLGGVDKDNFTLEVINTLSSLTAYDYDVEVIIGGAHPALQEVQSACDRNSYTCYVQADNVHELMLKADLSIGAAGSTSWERCCLGLPSICLTLAKNQEAIAEGLEYKGVALNLSANKDDLFEKLSSSIVKLILAPDCLKDMSQKAFNLVDGFGAQKVVGTMMDNENINSDL